MERDGESCAVRLKRARSGRLHHQGWQGTTFTFSRVHALAQTGTRRAADPAVARHHNSCLKRLRRTLFRRPHTSGHIDLEYRSYICLFAYYFTLSSSPLLPRDELEEVAKAAYYIRRNRFAPSKGTSSTSTTSSPRSITTFELAIPTPPLPWPRIPRISKRSTSCNEKST